MNQYSYSGPVIIFGRCVSNNWTASTYAVSEKKAKSNLMYQYKKQNNKVAGVRVELPGKILLRKEKEDGQL